MGNLDCHLSCIPSRLREFNYAHEPTLMSNCSICWQKAIFCLGSASTSSAYASIAPLSLLLCLWAAEVHT